MITHWIKIALVWVLKLIIPPPPTPQPIVPIDPNSPCVGCGNRDGYLTTVKMANNDIMVMHNCKVCKARWFEKPLVTQRNIVHAINIKDVKAA